MTFGLSGLSDNEVGADAGATARRHPPESEIEYTCQLATARVHRRAGRGTCVIEAGACCGVDRPAAAQPEDQSVSVERRGDPAAEEVGTVALVDRVGDIAQMVHGCVGVSPIPIVAAAMAYEQGPSSSGFGPFRSLFVLRGGAAAKPVGPGDAPIAVLPDVEGVAAGVADLDDVAGDDEVVEPCGVVGGEVQAAV